MVLKLVEVGTSGIFGALDIGTEYADETLGYTKPFQNITDWARTGAVVGGYLGNVMKFGPEDVTGPLVLSGIPLLEKSVYNAVKFYALGKKGKRLGLRLKKPGRRPGTPTPPTTVRWG